LPPAAAAGDFLGGLAFFSFSDELLFERQVSVLARREVGDLASGAPSVVVVVVAVVNWGESGLELSVGGLGVAVVGFVGCEEASVLEDSADVEEEGSQTSS